MDAKYLNAEAPHLQYAEERLAMVALVGFERPSPLLSVPANEVDASLDFVAPRRLVNFLRQEASAAHTFDWRDNAWERVDIDVGIGARCLEAVEECAPAMYHWSRFAIRSLSFVAPPSWRPPWVQLNLSPLRPEPPWDTDEWKEARVTMVSTILVRFVPS